MKVYLEPTTSSRGIMRVRDALVQYAPKDIEIVSNESDADLVVIHVYGRRNQIKAHVDALREKGKQYTMIQYAIRSTQEPSTFSWYPMWKDAKLVWSYYDLKALMKEDLSWDYPSLKEMAENGDPNFRFYYAPLGVDASKFKETYQQKEFIIHTHSQGYLVESVRECIFAARNVKQKVFYSGKELKRPDVFCRTGIPDWELANWYSQCRYVSGLRRLEGFELPVIEGALCGARPIVFDKPHYRQWFDKFAIFIPEGTREEVIESLTTIFDMKMPAPGVTEEEKELIRKTFNWETIIKEFWTLVK